MTALEAVHRVTLHAGPPGREGERGLLLGLARLHPPAAPREGVDWEYLLDTAERHGLLPLLAHHAATGFIAPPASVRERLRGAAALHLAENLRLLAMLRDLLGRFRERGIPVLAFKGPALAVQAYGNVGLRPISDLDVVIRPADAARAHPAMLDAGFEPELALSARGEAALTAWEHHRGYVAADGRTLVELHWRFAQLRFGLRLGAEEVIGRAASLPLAGTDVPVPSPEDQVLLLCVHGARHLWERLEWIGGLAELLRRQPPEWGVVLERADAAHARRLLHLGLVLAHALLDAPLPEPVLRAATADRAALRLASEAGARLFSDAGPAQEVAAKPELFLFNLRAKDRVTDRIRFAFGYLTTPTEDYWYGPRLPDRLFPLYRVYRPFRLAGQYLAARVRGR